jgi:serine/threonine-protein kinase
MKPIQIGDTVGDYRVIDIAGAGGMGTVYKIEHLITRRIEAMKLLPPGAIDDPEQVARFEREIQVQARLHHPNIVGLYNAVRNGDLIALVMEYVEGESLQRMLEAGPLPVETAVDFTRQVLGALVYAHDAGVIHRDVAPANIIVTADGTAKLTDFGLARAAMDVRLSASGVPLGSPWYMSPEQVRGVGTLDARTDIYAMGAVLFEMLTGEKLFPGAGAFAVMRAHVEAEPAAPSSRNPRVSAALDGVVRKALAKNPAKRFQSAHEFRQAMEHAMEHVAERAAANARPVSTPRIAWSAGIAELTGRLRRYRPSRLAMVSWVVAGGLLAGFYTTRLFPAAARARVAERAPRPAAVPQAQPQSDAPAEPVPAAQVASAPVVAAPTVVAPAATQDPAAPRPRRRVPVPAPVLRRAGQGDPRFALRVTGEEREPAAALSPPVTHFRPLAEAPEPFVPKPEPVAAPVAEQPAVSATAPQPAATSEAASQKTPNGNRFVRALGKVNPFHKRTKHADGDAAQTPPDKD